MLPEKDAKVNFAMGCFRNKFADLAAECRSDNAATVAAYFRKSEPFLVLQDYDDFGQQCVKQTMEPHWQGDFIHEYAYFACLYASVDS